MTVNKINSNAQSASAQAVQKVNTASQSSNNIQKINQQGTTISPLSSRYTYAIGQDGKRYVLQLRIDISSVKAFSSLA